MSGGFEKLPYEAAPERGEFWKRELGARKGRVLDVGCGDGGTLRALETVNPAQYFGIDISAANIDAARKRSRPGAIEFVLGDYLTTPFEPMDLIISDSTMHNIVAPTRPLFAKVAADLSPEGELWMTIPSPCLSNRLLWGIRRMFRAVRGKWLDELIFRLARRLHGGEYSEQGLRDRVEYMYLLPHFRDDAALSRILSDTGLVVFDRRPIRHASLGQPKHNLVKCRKVPALTER